MDGLLVRPDWASDWRTAGLHPPPPTTPHTCQVHKRRGVCLFFTDTDTLTGFFGLAFHAPSLRVGTAWVVSEDRQMFLERGRLNPYEKKGFDAVDSVWRGFPQLESLKRDWRYNVSGPQLFLNEEHWQRKIIAYFVNNMTVHSKRCLMNA